MTARVVFMGSPEFALPVLRRLARAYEVVGVVTQPDRPAGRGNVLTPPAVKTLALELGLPVIQPQRLKEEAAFEQLKAWQPDVIVVAAFGQILRKPVLELAAYGCINVHASLLPRWRGAAPIQAAILHGDAATGVSIMKMDAGIDTGPILTQQEVKIDAADTAGTLSERLAAAGGELLLKTLPGFFDGDILPTSQDETQATYAPMLKKQDGLLDFNQPAEALAFRVRAFNPWPGASMLWEGQILKIHTAHPTSGDHPSPGTTVILNGLPAVTTRSGFLVLDEVQPAGKRTMAGKVFLQGARSWGKAV